MVVDSIEFHFYSIIIIPNLKSKNIKYIINQTKPFYIHIILYNYQKDDDKLWSMIILIK